MIDLIEEKKIVKKTNKPGLYTRDCDLNMEVIKFEKFNKNAKTYVELINHTYLQYKTIEEKSLEIEKIIKLYLDHFVEKNKIVKFL